MAQWPPPLGLLEICLAGSQNSRKNGQFYVEKAISTNASSRNQQQFTSFGGSILICAGQTTSVFAKSEIGVLFVIAWELFSSKRDEARQWCQLL